MGLVHVINIDFKNDSEFRKVALKQFHVTRVGRDVDETANIYGQFNALNNSNLNGNVSINSSLFVFIYNSNTNTE